MSDPDVIKATIPAADWLANPEKAHANFVDMLASIPDQHPWAAYGSAILGALYAIGRFAPVIQQAAPFIALIPGAGPILTTLAKASGLVANLTWKATAHANQKLDDAIKADVHEAAKIAAPFLTELKAADIDYPDSVRNAITPEVLAALQRLAAEA